MAQKFGGGTDYLEVASHTDFDLSEGTISMWSKTSQSPANIFLNGRLDSATRDGFVLFIKNDANESLACQVADSGGVINNLISTTPDILDGAWHHIALQFRQANGAECAVYVDGTQSTSGTNSAAWTFDSQTLRWGDAPDTFWASHAGDIAEAAWYTGILTVAEIKSLSNNYSPLLVRPENLISYWDIVRGINDRVSAHNMTITGTVTASSHPSTIYPAPPFISYPSAADVALQIQITADASYIKIA